MCVNNKRRHKAIRRIPRFLPDYPGFNKGQVFQPEAPVLLHHHSRIHHKLNSSQQFQQFLPAHINDSAIFPA